MFALVNGPGDVLGALLFLAFGAGISLVTMALFFFVLYRVIRAAIRDGLRDARKEGPL